MKSIVLSTELLLAVVALSIFSVTHAAPSFLGPTPYLSSADSPLSGSNFDYFHLEDFEDLNLNTPGVSASAGTIGVGPRGFRDSVDGDDGTIDGDGSQGASLFIAATGSADVTFTFDAGVLGSLPTHVGIVWTDTESP